MNPAQASESVESLLEAGLQALDAGNLTLALSKFNAVLSLDAANPRAERLVRQLEQTIQDGRRAAATPASGEFVVVVDESESEIRADLRPNVISRSTLDRLNRLLEEATSVNESLGAQLGAAEASALSSRQLVSDRDRAILAAQERLIEVETALARGEDERRDQDRLRRVRERQTAELELRLAERRAFEKKALEEIRSVTQTRDQLRGEVERLDAQLASARAQIAQLNDQLDHTERARRETDNARAESERARAELESSRAALDVARAEAVGRIAQLETERGSLAAELASRDAALASAEERRASLALQVEQGAHALAAAEHAQAALAAELARATAALEAASLDRDQARSDGAREVTEARAALADSQSARSAMRTEMATMVHDLEAARVAAERSLQRVGELEAEVAAATGDAAARAAMVDELAAERSAVAALKSDAQALAATITSLEVERDTAHSERDAARVALESVMADLEAARSAARTAQADQSSTAAATDRSLTELRMALEAAELRASGADGELARVREELARVEAAHAGAAAEAAAGASAAAELQAASAALDDLRRKHNALIVSSDAARAEVESRLEETRCALTQSQEGLRARDAEGAAAPSASGPLQAEIERLRADLGSTREALQAAHERARRAEAAARGKTSTTAPIRPLDRAERPHYATPAGVDVMEMSIDDEAAPRGATPVESASVTGAFRAAEEAERATTQSQPPPIPSAARSRVASGPAFSTTDLDELQGIVSDGLHERAVTPLDNSAVQRLHDASLPPTDRLRWLIDEQPFVHRTDQAPRLSAQAAFVLQNIDGAVSFADLIDIVGLPADETAGILVELLCSGVITSPSLRA